MAHYTFRFRQGSRSSDVDVDLPDDDTAWDEAAAVCLPFAAATDQRMETLKFQGSFFSF
jgi:hypothetical protein